MQRRRCVTGALLSHAYLLQTGALRNENYDTLLPA